jgi:hypothetical protein
MANTLGTNLGGISFWSSQMPFVDIFKSASEWITQNSNSWDTGEASELNLDENGWVKSLPKPGDPNADYNQVGVMLNRISPAPGVEQNYPGGKYVVLYDGEGKLEYGFDAKLDASASKPGRDVINVTPSDTGIHIKLTETDPKGTGDYIRNIRVVPEALEKNYQTQPFNPNFVDKVDDFSTLRFMDWMDTNNSKQGDWKNRPTTSNHTYEGKGVPVEVMVDLANRTGANPWFTIPHQATDEYVTNFAKIVKEKLDPKLKAYVEYSNEVWNGQFQQNQWAQQQGQKLGGDWMDWHSRRTEQIGDLWDNVFGKDSNRVVTVLGSQAANPWITEQLMEKVKAYDPNFTVDTVAIAPYVSLSVGPDKQAEVEGWTKESDGGLGKVFDYLNKTELPQVLDNISKQVDVTKKYDVDIAAYEGGQHLVGIQGVENNQAITDLLIAANRDPRMGQLYSDYLQGWDKLTNGSLFVNFSDIGTPSKWGSWGALEHLNQKTSPKWEALQDFMKSNGQLASKDPSTETGTGDKDSGDNLTNKGDSNTLTDKEDANTLTDKEGNDIPSSDQSNKVLAANKTPWSGDNKNAFTDQGDNDILTGGQSNDMLWERRGNDAINGVDGNDRLIGGLGQDMMTGDAGSDRLMYNGADFGFNQDVVDLRQMMLNRGDRNFNTFSEYIKSEPGGADIAVRPDMNRNVKPSGLDNNIFLQNNDPSNLIMV